MSDYLKIPMKQARKATKIFKIFTVLTIITLAYYLFISGEYHFLMIGLIFALLSLYPIAWIFINAYDKREEMK